MAAVDYFSQYLEFTQLSSITSKEVIENLKQRFDRNGVPVILRKDPGSQYIVKEFADFARIWDFQNITNSPRFFQCNEAVEAVVKIRGNKVRKQ